MQKLKIAIFSGTIPSTTFIEQLIKGVAGEVEVLLFGVKTKPVKYKQYIKLYRTPGNKWNNLVYTLCRGFRLMLERPKDLKRLFEVVRKYKTVYEKWIWFSKFMPIVLYRPHVFHIQWARDIEFYMCLKTEFSIPIIISLRGAHINYTPITKPRIAEIYKKYFPQVDGFHAVSQAIAKEAQKYGANGELIQVIHSPINKSVYQRFREGKYKEHSGKSIQLVSVGRFHWKKGYTYGLSAIKHLRDKGYEVNYTIVATNPIPEAILFQINQQNLKDSVKIVGGMSHDELLSFVQGFDLMLLPSMEEGIANVVLEAMAMGVLVVSSNCGGMSEVVKNKETGWLVPSRDSEALAFAVEEFLSVQAEELNKMAARAHELIMEEFEAGKVMESFKYFYRNIYEKNNA